MAMLMMAAGTNVAAVDVDEDVPSAACVLGQSWGGQRCACAARDGDHDDVEDVG